MFISNLNISKKEKSLVYNCSPGGSLKTSSRPHSWKAGVQAGVVHVELDSIQLRRLKLAEVGGPAEEVKLCKLSSQRPAGAAAGAAGPRPAGPAQAGRAKQYNIAHFISTFMH